MALIYIFFSKPIAIFLYNDVIVAEYIRIMGFATILIGLQHNLTGILYGLNKQNSATFNRLIGMFTQVILTYTLVGHPSFGVNGIFISYYGLYVVVMILDLVTLDKMRFIKSF